MRSNHKNYHTPVLPLRLTFLVVITAMLCLLLGSCSGLGLRPEKDPNAPLSLSVRGVDFEAASANQVVFQLHGAIKNPNIRQIDRVAFSYETYVEDKRVESGQVESSPNFLFKSRTPFTVPIRIPTRFLGGYVQAQKRDGVTFKVNLNLTDERLMRTTLTYTNQVHLSSLLELPLIYVSSQLFNTQTVVDLAITNPNNFVLVMDSCSVVVVDDPQQRRYRMFVETAFAANATQSERSAITYQAEEGKRLAIAVTCTIDGSDITLTREVVVTKNQKNQT